jgi:uncharacterized repeat protein (TIGR03803 family)
MRALRISCILFAATIVFATVCSAQIFTVIATFDQGLSTVNNAAPVRDANGNLYSVSAYGGLANCNQGEGCGFVYTVDPTGKTTVLYNFQGAPDGLLPVDPLVLDGAGNIYGTTRQGGAHNAGIIFKLEPTGQETVLYSFGSDANDGNQPYSGVTRDALGNLYGTTLEGGKSGCYGKGCGTVYKFNLTSAKETVLYRFTGGTDGGAPWATPLLAGNTLYGTTNIGGDLQCNPGGNGVPGCGVIYSLSNTGETVLHAFDFSPDGGYPQASVIRDSAGNLYGTTLQGGDLNCVFDFGCGTAYELSSSGTLTVLHSFQGTTDGSYLSAGLTYDQGSYYGSTGVNGGIFQINGSGSFSIIAPLIGSGVGPSTMITDGEGNMYGTWLNDVFRLEP